MNRSERILSYSKGYDKLIDALKEFPKEMRHFKPAPEKWSVNEIIIHIADSEANSFCRARKLIVEPGSTIMVYDQDAWAARLNYAEQSTEDALELFKVLRRNTYNVIKNLPDEIWNHYIEHPESGRMSMEKWLITYDDHIPIHINQMKRNLAEWNKQKK